MRWRLSARFIGRYVLRCLFRVLTRLTVHGLEEVPAQGPLVIAFNHLAHLDVPLLMAFVPRELEALALSDLYEIPVIGSLLRVYGAIPVHRGRFDRAVLQKALTVLSESGAVALAPEGRMSVTRSLERATHGAAYLALSSSTPVLPVAVTGTELVSGALRRFRRAHVTMVLGEVYHPPARFRDLVWRRRQVEEVTEAIMLRIAALLPPAYRGEYGRYCVHSMSTGKSVAGCLADCHPCVEAPAGPCGS